MRQLEGDSVVQRFDLWTNEEHENLYKGLLMYGKSVSDLTKVVQKRTRDAIYKKMHNLRKNGTDYSGKPIPEVVLEILNDRINH